VETLYVETLNGGAQSSPQGPTQGGARRRQSTPLKKEWPLSASAGDAYEKHADAGQSQQAFVRAVRHEKSPAAGPACAVLYHLAHSEKSYSLPQIALCAVRKELRRSPLVDQRRKLTCF
jgi:hypothetical protein